MSATVVPAGDFLAGRSVAELARLLEHPAIWRGRSAARAEVLPTGYAAFDACLPGGGWPRTGLIEILVSRFGVGELYLLFPALAALTCRPAARWCVWVAPPLEPYAPALNAHGAALERMLVVRPSGDRAATERRPSGQRGNPQRGSAREPPAGASERTPSGGARLSHSGLLSKRSARAPATSHWPGRPGVRVPARFAACNSLPSEVRHSASCFVRSALRRNPPRRSCASPWSPNPEARASRS
jgi:hypothetical protein